MDAPPNHSESSSEAAAAVSAAAAEPDLNENVWIAPCKLEKVKTWKSSIGRVYSLGVWGGRLVSGHDDGVIRVWAADDLERVEKVLTGQTHEINALLEWNGLLASASYDATIRLWGEDGECVRVLRGHEHWILCLALFQGRLSSGSWDGTVRLWDFESGECVTVLREHEGWVQYLAEFGPFLVSGSLDKTLRFWNSRGECDHRIEFDRHLTSLAVWGNLLVVGLGGGKIELVSSEGEHVRVLREGEDSGSRTSIGLVVVDHGHLVNIDYDRRVSVFRRDGSVDENRRIGRKGDGLHLTALGTGQFVVVVSCSRYCKFTLLSRVLSPLSPSRDPV